MGGGREDGQLAEFAIQPFSSWKEVYQDMDTWERFPLEEKPKRDSKKLENLHLCLSSIIEIFCILFLDIFEVYSRVSLLAKNNIQLWICQKVA